MTSIRQVIVHPDAVTLAEATAARLITRLIDLQSVSVPVHLVLTGGNLGIAILSAVTASPAVGAVDWSNIHLWWGDERFLPQGDPDRNETQARLALIGPIGDALPAENVHPMPALNVAKGITTPEDSAALYVSELREFADQGCLVPRFDVLLLGMGPDGHVASLFPGAPALNASGVAAIGIRNAPKSPPLRVSLTLEAICLAKEVWVATAGATKAAAVSSALRGTEPKRCPVAGVHGTQVTLWLVDAAAIAELD